ncbi:MAG TPA: hypothetical protein VHO50_05545 [Bacteroidales bacterium]|nr:hypothetical protein [Bacteroidales bacterium]
MAVFLKAQLCQSQYDISINYLGGLTIDVEGNEKMVNTKKLREGMGVGGTIRLKV